MRRLLLLCFLGGLAQASAQTDPSRLREATGIPPLVSGVSEDESLMQRGLDEENGFMSKSEGDDDIGQQLVLKQTPKGQPFRAWFDNFALWSNNAANVATGEQTDWMWGGRVGAGWQRQIASHWFADVSLTQGIYRYHKSSALDFEAMEAMATILDVEPRLWNIVFVGSLGFQRITSSFLEESLLNSLSARLAAQRLIILDRHHSIQLGISSDFDLANDVKEVFRDEYAADIAWRFKMTRQLALSLGYRLTYLNYKKVDRSDLLHVAGVTLSYTPNKWTEIYATFNHALNDSDIDFFDYETVTAGAGLGMKVKF